MTGIRVDVADLCEGAVLASDLYVENRKLMGSGSYVTNRLISVLKRRNVKSIEVLKEQLETEQPSMPEQGSVKLAYQVKKEPIHYLAVLGELNIEQRYGRALQQIDDMDYVARLFDFFMQSDTYRTLLEQLREYDYYTFLHVVDVFTLGTLLAKKEGVLNIEELALGFLLHDVGKLKTPRHILMKRGKLTLEEMEVVQRHTIDGEEMLQTLGLQSISYLARSHHEQEDGKGYPDGVLLKTLAKEVQILRLIDVYSAITLQRPYREKVIESDAIAMMYKDKHLFDEELLSRFVDFIGIYPCNAVVLLSDGSHAIVEKVNEANPLLPTVRQFETGAAFGMPYDFKLTIHKMLSYDAETPDQLLAKFSDLLINNEEERIGKYYQLLKDHYRAYEWYTHIHIPVYQIFCILKRNRIVQEVRLQEMRAKFMELLTQTTIQLRLLNKKKEMVLLLVDEKMKSPVAVQLLEGLFHSEETHSVIVTSKMSEVELNHLIDCCQITHVYALGEHSSLSMLYSKKLQLHHLAATQLEGFLNRMSRMTLHGVSLKDKLSTFCLKQTLTRH